MKYDDFPYERPDMKELDDKFNLLLERITSAKNCDEQDEAMRDINKIRDNFDTSLSIVYTRYTGNTEDEFYKAEQDFFDESEPVFHSLVSKYYQAILNSPYRKELEKKWGEQLFTVAELESRIISPEVLEDLQLENKLSSEYTSLTASAKIMFEGKERNLSQLTPFMQSPDRDMRKRANEARYTFFEENRGKYDEIYDKLVKLRAKIAHKLGFKSFVELGYARMNRSDYDAKMASEFRKQVEKHITPITAELRERQRKRLGLDSLKYYDEKFNFKTGNPMPKGDPEWIINNGVRMYSELSPETNEFFSFMIENNLMDLVTRKGKAGGGYSLYFGKFKAPYIFSNFNGTSGDITVLTHEVGHAFQKYCIRHIDTPEYYRPTSECSEVYSISMEYLTWPWMELFFREDTDKFKFNHMAEALFFIPYAAAVDEFQHYVYDNPDISPKERKCAWREIEKKYIPYRDYDGNSFLEEGGYWQQQLHIYTMPFYYIDYALAYISALQFWKRSMEDREEAWKDYLSLCSIGGSKSFVGFVKHANLISPFDSKCIESIVGTINDWLNSIDDKVL